MQANKDFASRIPETFYLLRKEAFDYKGEVNENQWIGEINDYVRFLCRNENESEALEKRGEFLCAYRGRGLIRYMYMAIEIFSEGGRDFEEYEQQDREGIREHFSGYSVEECCLLLIDGFLRTHCVGAECVQTLLEHKIFLPEVCVFHSSCKQFLEFNRNLELSYIEKRLDDHIVKLENPLVTLRKDIQTFESELMPYFEETLSVSSLRFLQTFLEQLKKERRWNALWYIFDRELFVSVVVKAYLTQSRINLSEMSEDCQNKQADFIFVCLFKDLINQKVQRWHDLASICWKLHLENFYSLS